MEYFYKYTCSDQSINLCILRDACHEIIILCLWGFLCDRDTWCRGSKITALQSLILNVHHLSIVIIWTFSDCLRFQGAVSHLSSLFCWKWQLCIRVCYGTSEITCEWQNHIFLSNKYVSQALYQTILNVITSKNKLWITDGYQVFKNQFYNPFQSSSIFSILGSFCIKIFCCVISTFFEGFDFLFHSIWWPFQLFEFCLILQDSSFNYQMNFLHRNLLCSVWWHKDSQRLIWQDNQSVGH